MTDKFTIRTVVVGLIAITVALIAGAVLLIALDKAVPDPIWTLGGTALGGLTALLVSTRSAPEVDPDA